MNNLACWLTLLCLFFKKSYQRNVHSESTEKNVTSEVVRAYPQYHSDLLFLENLKKENYELDFWAPPRQAGLPVDIKAEAENLKLLKAELLNNNIQFEVLIEDVNLAVKVNLLTNQQARTTSESDDFFNAYHTYGEIVEWMKNLERLNPSRITLLKVGRSYDLKTMYAVKLSKRTHPKCFKPAMWIDGGMHGREWISPAVVMYVLNELSNNTIYETILDSMDFYFMPVLNPDGYTYSFTEEGRLWRKTRSKTKSLRNCVGVDPNRNWGYQWNGSIEMPCSETYPGAAPFTEKEILHARDVIMSNFVSIKGYLNYHSYGQLWLFPWGYTSELIDDFTQLEYVSSQAVDAIYTYRGIRYKQQPLCVEQELCIHGNSIDWMKGVSYTKYTFLIQLPDLGNYGFLLPPSEIRPTGEESLRGLLTVANAIINDH